MTQTPSARRRQGRHAFYPEGRPEDHNPYLRSKVWGSSLRSVDWADGWREAKATYELQKQVEDENDEQPHFNH